MFIQITLEFSRLFFSAILCAFASLRLSFIKRTLLNRRDAETLSFAEKNFNPFKKFLSSLSTPLPPPAGDSYIVDVYAKTQTLTFPPYGGGQGEVTLSHNHHKPIIY
jgi:hypothetical protein